MLFDSHTHLNFKAFNDDRAEVINRCKEKNMLVMNVGAAIDTSRFGVELAQQYDFMYASVGLHPIHVYDEEFVVNEYQELIDSSNGRVRAVGETGIDFFHIKNPDATFIEVLEKQQDIFKKHIALAQKNDLALIIHGRNGNENMTAYKEIYTTVKDARVTRGVVHCYGGDLEEAKMFTGLGLYIGITGIATFDKTGRLREIIDALPLEKLLIETDAPYLAPAPHRGERNEPSYVEAVANYIAEVKGLKVESVIQQTGENAKQLYALT